MPDACNTDSSTSKPLSTTVGVGWPANQKWQSMVQTLPILLLEGKVQAW